MSARCWATELRRRRIDDLRRLLRGAWRYSTTTATSDRALGLRPTGPGEVRRGERHRSRCRGSGRPSYRAASSGARRIARCRAGWATPSPNGSAWSRSPSTHRIHRFPSRPELAELLVQATTTTPVPSGPATDQLPGAPVRFSGLPSALSWVSTSSTRVRGHLGAPLGQAAGHVYPAGCQARSVRSGPRPVPATGTG